MSKINRFFNQKSTEFSNENQSKFCQFEHILSSIFMSTNMSLRHIIYLDPPVHIYIYILLYYISGEFRGVQGISGEFRGVQGSSGEFRGVQGSSGEFRGVQGSSGEFRGVHGNSGEFIGVKMDIGKYYTHTHIYIYIGHIYTGGLFLMP